MLIGFDGSRAFVNNRTGTENYSYQLLLHLAKQDFTNHYHVYLRPPVDLKSIHSSFPWPANFKFFIINYPSFWTQFGLSKQTFLDKVDLLFIPAHTLPLIRRPKLKTVITVHDLGAEYLPTMHQLKQRLYLNFITHYQLKSASHLIAVSESTKYDLINKVGIPENKISVIHEGYDKNLYKPIKNDTLVDTLKYYDLQSKKYFLFVGTIQPRKNLERLIRAYALFLNSLPVPLNQKSPPKLILAGSPGWLSEEVYKLPKQLGIGKYVKFLGFVPNDDLPALYTAAQALLFPSLFEGFGIPILEAMACGCPVLTSNTSSCPEVAGKAAILVNPYSIDSISEGILQLTTNLKLQAKLTNLGLRQVKKFSWKKCAQQTLQVLTNVYQSK